LSQTFYFEAILDCGGKRSATPLLPRQTLPCSFQSAVAADALPAHSKTLARTAMRLWANPLTFVCTMFISFKIQLQLQRAIFREVLECGSPLPLWTERQRF
jgi:hypothetical protein